MKMHKKWTYIIGWILSTAAMAYLIYRLSIFDDYPLFAQHLSSVTGTQAVWIVAVLLLLPVQVAVEAVKWQWILRGVTTISFPASLAQVLYGYVGGFITPYRLGEYPARILRMGYSLDDWQGILGSWRQWLRDWRKWLTVLCLHLLRYAVWMLQLWAVLAFCGVSLTPAQALWAIPTYYLLISIMPSLPAADVPIKGGWATVVFGAFTMNTPAILLAVTLIWFINTVIPTIIGAFMLKK